MQLRHFVIMCSVMLLGWLAMAFVHEVPSNRYTVSAGIKDSLPLEAAAQPAELPEVDEWAVSVSH